MTEHGVGAVVVSDFGRMIGIFTERDLMRAVAGRVHSSEARVREWMTPDPVTMTEDASVEEAGETMIERGFRHIPVVAGERAVGIVSIRDVAEWRLKEHIRAKGCRRHRGADAVSGACRPLRPWRSETSSSTRIVPTFSVGSSR